MPESHKASNRMWARLWRSENHLQASLYNDLYRLVFCDEINARRRKRRVSENSKVLSVERNWIRRNRDKWLAKKRRYYRKHREQCLKVARDWAVKNRDKSRAIANRYASK